MSGEDTTKEETPEETVEVTPEQEVEALGSAEEVSTSRDALVAQLRGLQAKKGSGGLADARAIKSLNARIEAHTSAITELREAAGIEVEDTETVEQRIEAGFRKNVEPPAEKVETETPEQPPTETVEETTAPTPETEETPAETPKPTAPETPEAVAPDEILDPDKVPVAAGLTGMKVNESPALKPFRMVGSDNKAIDSLGGIQAALAETKTLSQGSRNWIGSFNPHGDFRSEQMLGKNAEDNFRLMYGEDTRSVRKNFSKVSGTAPTDPNQPAFQASLNCAGPVQPVMDIPFCYSGGRPLQDSGFIANFPSYENGQIQLYDCHELPQFPDLIQDASKCEDTGPDEGCGACGDYECAGYQCIVPGEPYTPEPYIQCMCLPEELEFMNPLILERALEDFAIGTDVAWELKWLKQLRELSLIRTVAPEVGHGGFNQIIRAILNVKSRLAIDPRCSGGLQDYGAFIPGGEAMFCATMADRLSRVLGCACPGEDLLEMITGPRFNIPVTFGLDQDPDGPAAAAGFTSVWDDTKLNTPMPLEPMVTAGEIMLIPRDTFITASPMSVEMGFEQRTKCEVGSGCVKMLRREWWFPVIPMGCRDSIVLEFPELCTSGTGPDLTAAEC